MHTTGESRVTPPSVGVPAALDDDDDRDDELPPDDEPVPEMPAALDDELRAVGR